MKVPPGKINGWCELRWFLSKARTKAPPQRFSAILLDFRRGAAWELAAIAQERGVRTSIGRPRSKDRALTQKPIAVEALVEPDGHAVLANSPGSRWTAGNPTVQRKSQRAIFQCIERPSPEDFPQARSKQPRRRSIRIDCTALREQVFHNVGKLNHEVAR
jgi:hypothetical protein